MKLRLTSPHTAAPAVEICVQAGENLGQAIWLSGLVPPQPLCAGLGRCGRCRLRFTHSAPAPLPAEQARFSEQELAQGWRLACRRQVPDSDATQPAPQEWELEVPPHVLFAAGTAGEAGAEIFLEGPGPDPEPDLGSGQAGAAQNAAGCEAVLAVDLGTTSLYWRALRSQDKTVVAQGHFLNPQAGAGADIMSRLAVARAPGGAARLSGLVQASLRGTVETLRAQGLRVGLICLAANTAMTDIFLQRELSGLCAAPYGLSHAGHEMAHVPGLPSLYIPSLPAPFVGGDVSAGLAALLARGTARPFVLADLGTNGELALVTAQETVWLTSVPLGPALEGIGLECGQLAGPDVLTEFCLLPAGLGGRTMAQVAAGAPHMEVARMGQVRGINATGYLSLLCLLRQAGLLEADGRFADMVCLAARPETMPLTRKLAAAFDARQGRLHLAPGLWLSAGDVEEVLKVKAAFALALEKILAAGQVAGAELAALCLAGALGEHVSPAHLESLGFVPAGLGQKLVAVGNASLEGAALLALDESAREASARLCARAHLLTLVEDPDFQHEYLRRMRFGV